MPHPIHILLVEDDPQHAELIIRALRRAGFDPQWHRVDTEAEYLSHLTADVQIILSDFTMPQFDGLRALELLKQRGLDIPFIIVSGNVGEALAVEAMRAGAHDYLMKDNLARLGPAIERELLEAENRRARRLAEAALRDSEDRYRDLVEHSHDLICTHDLEGRILSANRAAEVLLGYDLDTLLKANIRDMLFPEFRQQFDDYIAELKKNGVARGTLAARTRAGEKRIWEYTNTLRTDGLAGPIVRGRAHDVTEQRRAERALKASESELRALFAAMTDVILVLDAEGRFLKMASADPAKMYRPPADAIGKTLHEVFPNQQADFFLAHIHRTIASGQMHRVEYRLQIGDAEVWFDGSVSPMSKDRVLWIARDITERKQAEEALRESEDRFRRYFELGLIGMAITSPAKGWLEVNDRLCEILGYERSELLNLTWAELTHPDDLAADVANFDRVMAGEIDGYTLDKRFIRKNGEIIQATLGVKCLRRADGAVDYFLALLQDITQRKQAEDALKQSRELFRALTENTADLIAILDAEATVCYITPSVYRMLGYTVEDFLGRNAFEIIHPDDAEAVAEALQAGIQHRDSGLPLEFRVRHHDQSWRVIEATDTNLLENEAVAGIVINAFDITERKQTEDALRKAEEKYRGIFENAVEGIFQSTPDGRFISANPSMARILGYQSPEELIATRTDVETQHYVNPGCQAELERRLAAADVVVGFECEVYRKDGSKIWSIENIRAVRDPSGAVVYYEGSIEDITDRKLLEDQLRQAQKMEAVGQLAGGVAHDFNNLLTAIIGYSELALMRLHENDPLQFNIKEIKIASERAASLTRQLLAFSRKQVLQPKVLALNAVVSEMEKMLRRLIGENINLQTTLQPQLGSIKADPGQIEQVIMNLAINARDAMPNGGKLIIETGNVYIGTEYTRQHIDISPGPYIMLAVSDTGMGMDAQTQKRIFDPFFTTKETGKGTGLGLATVYGIIKQSGGNILVDSEVDRGTTFKIYLPRIDEGAPTHEGGAESEASLRGSETILLVEDEEIVRKVTYKVLQAYGYRVLEAANGDEALQIGERYQEPIHLLLSDVVMPGMGGRELADRLSPSRPGMKVLYMSGYTDSAIVHQGVLYEGINYVQKPFTLHVLIRKVREVLDK